MADQPTPTRRPPTPPDADVLTDPFQFGAEEPSDVRGGSSDLRSVPAAAPDSASDSAVDPDEPLSLGGGNVLRPVRLVDASDSGAQSVAPPPAPVRSSSAVLRPAVSPQPPQPPQQAAAAAAAAAFPGFPSASSADGDHSETDEPHAPRRPEPKPGERLGRYVVTRILGRGGMGVVYEAQDPAAGRLVAIKALPEELADDEKALQRFQAEGKSAGLLNHPHVVRTFGVECEDETHFMVMELVRGPTLQQIIDKEGRRPWREAVSMMIAACKGLKAAHDAGLIHRDLKPANIMRDADGVVKLADFGLAKNAVSTGKSARTTGLFAGTPDYMSPEQCRSERADIRSDIYAMGATLYCLLAGNAPYAGKNASVVQIMFAHCSKPVPDPRNAAPDCPEGVAGIVRTAMAKDPAARYQDAGAMVRDLEAVLAGRPPKLTLSLGPGSVVLNPPSGSGGAGAAAAMQAPSGARAGARPVPAAASAAQFAGASGGAFDDMAPAASGAAGPDVDDLAAATPSGHVRIGSGVRVRPAQRPVGRGGPGAAAGVLLPVAIGVAIGLAALMFVLAWLMRSGGNNPAPGQSGEKDKDKAPASSSFVPPGASPADGLRT